MTMLLELGFRAHVAHLREHDNEGYLGEVLSEIVSGHSEGQLHVDVRLHAAGEGHKVGRKAYGDR